MPKSKSGSAAGFKNYFIIILSVVAFSLVYVYESVHVIMLGYSIQKKNDELFKLTIANDRLNLELSRLTSLEKLDKIARTKLGLKFPDKDEVVIIDGSSINLK